MSSQIMKTIPVSRTQVTRRDVTASKQSAGALGAAPVKAKLVRSRCLKVRSTAEAEPAAEKVVTPAQFVRDLPGVTAPLGFFDPLGFSEGKDISEIKRFREAELTHGRVAMLACLGVYVGDKYNPLFDGSITGPAADQFQQVPGPFWQLLVFIIALCETYRASVGWVEPNKGPFKIRDEYTAGDIGFDPMGFKGEFFKSPSAYLDIQTKELNNGRLAMIAIAGFIVQEKVSGLPVFQ